MDFNDEITRQAHRHLRPAPRLAGGRGEAAMDWIRTTEKMPENGVRVVIYTPFEFFGEAHTCIGDKQSITDCTTRQGRRQVPVFTHWMPLPKLPDVP
jgi:hypothetical protein